MTRQPLKTLLATPTASTTHSHRRHCLPASSSVFHWPRFNIYSSAFLSAWVTGLAQLSPGVIHFNAPSPAAAWVFFGPTPPSATPPVRQASSLIKHPADFARRRRVCAIRPRASEWEGWKTSQKYFCSASVEKYQRRGKEII